MNISNKKRSDWIIMIGITITIFVYTFGTKLSSLNILSFANYLDMMKNYFTLVYYTDVQKGDFLRFSGMNYPYDEHVLFTDNTPLLALMLKVLGISGYSVGAFNLMVLSNFILAPLLAFGIGKQLKFNLLTNIAFSLFVVWMNPQFFRMTSSSNLSLSFILIGAFLLVLRAYKSQKTFSWSLLASVFLLVYISSFIHLYYLLLTVFICVPAFVILMFSDAKKGLYYVTCTLLAGIAVFLTIYLSDPEYALRPKGGLGFNYHMWRTQTYSLTYSYDFLNLPSFWKHKEYNPDWFSFIGSAYPLTAIGFLLLLIKKRGRVHLIWWAILGIGALGFFTAIGSQIQLFDTWINNYLNPLYLASFVTDTFNNFRFLSRFSFATFVAISIATFGVLNWIYKEFTWGKYIVIPILILYMIDTTDCIQYIKKGTLKTTIEFENPEREIPDFKSASFDAIMPLPYFHVGSELKGHIIDDVDSWSSTVYSLSLSNSIPMMATKLSRTPEKYVKAHFSLFVGEKDTQIMNDLKGKKILVAYDTTAKPRDMADEPAKSIGLHPHLFIDRWSPSFLLEKDGIRYYELRL